MKEKLKWKIRDVKLNKKNFWLPLLISSILSLLIFLFILAPSFFENSKGGETVIIFLQITVILSFFVSMPGFFIIKRLLSKKPKKVFYLELPILIIIYSVICSFNQIIGLMIGGPIGMTTLQLLTLILPPIIFIIIWLSLLTISLYFYYEKFVTKNL